MVFVPNQLHHLAVPTVLVMSKRLMQLRSNTEDGRRRGAAKPRAMRGGGFAALSCADDGDDSTGDDDGDDGDDASGDGAPAHKRRRGGRSPGGSPGSQNGAAIHPFGDGDNDVESVEVEVSEEEDVDDDNVGEDGEGEGVDDNLGDVVPAQQQPDTFDKVVDGSDRRAAKRAQGSCGHGAHGCGGPLRGPAA